MNLDPYDIVLTLYLMNFVGRATRFTIDRQRITSYHATDIFLHKHNTGA